MDRRSWLKLVTILTAGGEAQSQQRGSAATPSPVPAGEGAGRGGRSESAVSNPPMRVTREQVAGALRLMGLDFQDAELDMMMRDRKSTRLNSSHLGISYAVFCLKKKKK